MRFKKLKLYTTELESELKFYSETLGFEILEQKRHLFSVKAGWSELIFEKSDKAFRYHYCFLIPSNQLHQALEWMEKRTEVVVLEDGGKIQNFESWNAESFYFFDASGNIAEFIVRYDLKNGNPSDFDISNIIGVNEMGLPTDDIGKINEQLVNELHTDFWWGDLDRFGTNGSQEGILLLPNYKLKGLWHPTSLKIKPEPFEAVIDNQGEEYFLTFRDEKLKIAPVE